MTEKDKPLKDDIFHSPLPKGPAGQFSYHVPFSNLVPAYGKNRKAAKDFLRWFHTKEVYGESGYAGPAGRAAAEAISKFIIVDMYAKAVQGMAPEQAVKWAHSELVKIYA
jgi:multiple sugar transport system substrate-binding protein